MPSTNEILVLIADTLAADSALGDWCLAAFGNRGSIYTGIDQQKPAPETHYPVVAITDIRQVRDDRPTHTWEAVIGCGIVQDAVDEVAGPPRRMSYRGLGQAEELREQVEASLVRGRFAKVTFAGHSEPINNYPLFVSFTAVTVAILRSGRRQT